MSKDYNWWDDPKNEEEVKRISWWNHDQNKEFVQLPIAIVNSDKYWVASTNDETKKILGDRLTGCSQGDTKEDAIKQLFLLIRASHEYSEDCRLNYQRFVPFRKGDWHYTGGKWFTIFGINIYFRYGKGMKGGWYIPLTKLNISVHSEWAIYKTWKAERKKLNSIVAAQVSDTTEAR